MNETASSGKWYTHVRRIPILIGRTSDGKRIPGGPYTPTQLIVAAAVAWLAAKTTWAWAHFDRVGNILTFLVLVAGPVFALGRLPAGSRSPLRAVFGLVAAFTAPAGGRYRGVPVRPPKPRRVPGVVVVVDDSAPPPVAPPPVAPVESLVAGVGPAPAGVGLSAIQVTLARNPAGVG